MLAMSYDDFKFFKLLDFANLDTWDVKRYFAKSLSSNFAIQSLGQYIIEQNTKVKPFDYPDDDFGILGVDNKVGIFDAYVQKGKEINQPYKLMKENFLAYNPYRINVGSIGLKDSSHRHQYISPAYVVFSCKQDLLPMYLFLLFKTQKFNKIIREATTGSVRQNLSFDNLSNLQIPLPSLEEQQTLVSAYQNKISQAEQLEPEAKQLEQNIENYLFDELGITINQPKTFETGKLQFIEFKDLHKWGVSVNQQGITAETIFQSTKYPNVSILDYFIINPTTKPPQDKEIAFVPMANVSDIYGKIVKQEPKKLEKGYTRFAENDIIWARITPCMENGKSAIATNLINGFGFGSTEFHVIRQKNTKFDKELLSLLLRTKRLRQVATTYFTGSAGQQRVPKEFLELLTLPIIESIDVQKSIINSVRIMQTKQRENIENACQLRQQAIQDFETAIFA